MPNIKSAKKRVSTTQKKNLRNRMVKSSMRTALKKYSTALAEGQGVAELHTAFSALDRAASKGVIHKNAANRKKARLAKHAAQAAQTN